MYNFKVLAVQELQQINGGMTAGKCLSGFAWNGVKGAFTGAGAGSVLFPVVGSVGGAVIGANVGMVAGAIKCARD